jgi:hypothetical protein
MPQLFGGTETALDTHNIQPVDYLAGTVRRLQ